LYFVLLPRQSRGIQALFLKDGYTTPKAGPAKPPGSLTTTSVGLVSTSMRQSIHKILEDNPNGVRLTGIGRLYSDTFRKPAPDGIEEIAKSLPTTIVRKSV